MPEDTIKVTEVETIKEPAKTIVSFNKPTPLWATLVFRAYLYLGGIATTIILNEAGRHRIPTEVALDIVQYITYGYMGVHLGSRALGVDVSKDEAAIKEITSRK